MAGDRPFIGILLMLCFCVLAPMGDAIAKLLGERLPVAQLVMLRFAIQAAILVPIVLATGGRLTMPRLYLALTALRTGLHIVGIGAMFLALRFLPLADAIAIAFVMPFLMLLLGHAVLGEEVGARRLIACIVGFGGTLLVIQPNFADVGAAALLPLAVAVAFALFMLVTRRIAKATEPIALQAVSGLMASAVLIPLIGLAEVFAWPGLDPVAPGTADWGLILTLGLLGTGAHLVMTWSLRFAPSATLAPMQYLEIPIATLVGWLVFRDFPDGLALIGIAVTVAAGLYIVLRERALSRRPTPGSLAPASAAAGSPASRDPASEA